VNGPGDLFGILDLLARSPGLASLRGRAGRAPVFVFHGAGSVPAGGDLEPLRRRGLLVADGAAALRLDTGSVRPDLRLILPKEPDCPIPGGGVLRLAGADIPVLLLPESRTWLAEILGHGSCRLPTAGDNLLLAALALGEGPVVWAGPAPRGRREILAGAAAAGAGDGQGRTVLVEKHSPSWFPGQRQVDLEVVGRAWKEIDREAALGALREAVLEGPSPRIDLVPGTVARAALPENWRTGNWVSPDHGGWLRFGAALYESLQGKGTVQTDQEEAEKYQVFWDDGHSSGHTSPGERVYPLVREFIRALGCRDFLEIGCGAGEVLEAAERDGLTPHALDIADGLVHTSRARYRKRLALGSAWKMPFADRSFDFVFSSDVFEHLPPSRLPSTLDELARVCRKGAALSISARADFTGLKWGAVLHLSVFPIEYWKRELGKRFEIAYAVEAGKGENPHYIFLLQAQAEGAATARAS